MIIFWRSQLQDYGGATRFSSSAKSRQPGPVVAKRYEKRSSGTVHVSLPRIGQGGVHLAPDPGRVVGDFDLAREFLHVRAIRPESIESAPYFAALRSRRWACFQVMREVKRLC